MTDQPTLVDKVARAILATGNDEHCGPEISSIVMEKSREWFQS